MTRRLAPALVLAAAALASAGCSRSKPAASSAPPAATSTTAAAVQTTTPPPAATTAAAIHATTARPAATTTAAPATATLTGFGATWDIWDATRVPDDNAPVSANRNTGYSPDAALPVTGAAGHDRYTVVAGTDTYVTSYQVNFHQGTGIAAAMADVLGREFPKDATWLWKQEVAGGCYKAEVKSAALAKATGAAGIGDGGGDATVEFRTLPPGGQAGYDPRDVTFATVDWLLSSADAKTAGC